MTDIRELLTGIREWQAAREAHANNDGTRGGTWHAVQRAAIKVTGSYLGSEELLPAFVALADHVDALEAKIERALAIPENDHYMSDGDREWGVAYGYNYARDEFRKALTSEPTASEGEA